MYKYSKMYLGGKNPVHIWQNQGLIFSINYSFSIPNVVYNFPEIEKTVNSDESVKYFLHETESIFKTLNYHLEELIMEMKQIIKWCHQLLLYMLPSTTYFLLVS